MSYHRITSHLTTLTRRVTFIVFIFEFKFQLANGINIGVVSTIAGKGSQGNSDGPCLQASFSSPSGVAVDARGNVYVADFNNNAVRMITPQGKYLNNLTGKK